MPASGNSAVDKALDLVEAVARSDRPLRLSEVADPLGLQRPTAHRVLADLVRRGWIMRIGDRYLPGTVVLQLSRATAAHSLVGIARPVLERLSAATSMMVNLQVPEEDRSRVVDVVRPERLEMISDLRDGLLPVHRFAGPLALVAAMDERARAPYLAAAVAAGHPLEGPDGLLADLDRAARTGWGVQIGRTQRMVASLSRAVHAPDGRPPCALTLVGPAPEFEEPNLLRLQGELRSASDELAAALGMPGGAR
ncbi:transcriptional regulator, IclR family [Actinacidiphila yanglinensis]|uniref:Transcriptional regulator, IclR family n=1 Tax=Actinacidiphila yanglinensis TaxID=310779 RepID=A0A1H5YRJ8_9ACTN|nr:helix-turn-helix domain-containing protein [Actinacidiphila yanglinensis]SEG26302.1 transcriptional regulator, IclR family [Actinacidiphila yanglinensis]